MNDIKNVMLCGLGAVGTVYAEKFVNNKDVNFRVLVNKERFERYSKSKLFFNNKPLSVEYILPEDTSFKADLIILATKTNDLDSALNEINNFVYDNTIILPLQNGVTSEIITAEKYGREKVIYSYFIGHSAVRVGLNITQDGNNCIVFGSDNKDDNSKIEKLKKLFDKSNINYEIPNDIKHSLWLKFMLNVSSNPTTALFRMTFGQMLSNEKFMILTKKIMKEVQIIARAEGVNNPDTLVDEALVILNKMSPEGKTSMLQDIEAGRKTEIDTFTGTICRLGDKHNIETPYCDMIYEFISVLEYGLK
jgi:2-dehydropantoate 2-reductase